jgi:hypothetical protein
MPRKKTSDPRLIALLDKKAKLQETCEREFRRMRRAFNRLEKNRRQLAKVTKRIDAMSRLDERIGSLDARAAY